MEGREQRGLVIAALAKIAQQNGVWIVPSQTSKEKVYVVNLRLGTCSCPDHQETGFKCKHQFAVEFTVRREHNADGTITETKSLTFTEEKKYTQDWPAYNRSEERRVGKECRL